MKITINNSSLAYQILAVLAASTTVENGLTFAEIATKVKIRLDEGSNGYRVMNTLLKDSLVEAVITNPIKGEIYYHLTEKGQNLITNAAASEIEAQFARLDSDYSNLPTMLLAIFLVIVGAYLSTQTHRLIPALPDQNSPYITLFSEFGASILFSLVGLFLFVEGIKVFAKFALPLVHLMDTATVLEGLKTSAETLKANTNKGIIAPQPIPEPEQELVTTRPDSELVKFFKSTTVRFGVFIIACLILNFYLASIGSVYLNALGGYPIYLQVYGQIIFYSLHYGADFLTTLAIFGGAGAAFVFLLAFLVEQDKQSSTAIVIDWAVSKAGDSSDAAGK